ncbi:MutS-related protein [Nocardia nova]|uniref:MutS-related protein n=1 Tax=Nocardia nova TaxID=37330 RepID=UPI0018951AD6|nr:DNA mismatch repair protein [Nocardia nova]MBF6150019.1 DNA mismatch repair protein [Nocardia nova]
MGLLQPPGHPLQVARNGAAVADDLNLGEMFAVMAAGDEFVASVVKVIVPAGLTDVETIRYRQGVLANFSAEPEMLRALYAIATEATTVRRWMVGRGRAPRSKLGLALQPLTALVGQLRKLRQTCEEYARACTSDGLVRFRELMIEMLDEDYLAGLETHLAALYFDDGVQFSAVLGPGNKADRIVLHEPPRNAKRSLFGRRSGAGFEATSDFDLPDDPLSAVIEPALDTVAEVVSGATDSVQDFFRHLRTELAFYLGCLNLRERFGRTGTPMCYPVPVSGTPTLQCGDLRDAVLCLSSGDVVGNDVDAAGVTFFVVSGANSGGKSTFLRSVGTAQVMMQAGMFVTAAAFTADVRNGLFTHFVRAEDPDMEHGRLDEELARMREVTEALRQGGMLLCNEPFASTNDREAAAIADPIMSALLDSGVKVVLVTHLYDFVRQRYATGRDTDLFLRAQRAPDGRRTYRVAAGAPEATSHGADIYARIFGDPLSGGLPGS